MSILDSTTFEKSVRRYGGMFFDQTTSFNIKARKRHIGKIKLTIYGFLSPFVSWDNGIIMKPWNKSVGRVEKLVGVVMAGTAIWEIWMTSKGYTSPFVHETMG